MINSIKKPLEAFHSSALIVFISLLAGNIYWNAWAEVAMPELKPVPQHIEWTQGKPADMDIGTLSSVVLSPSVVSIQAGIDHINERLAEIGRAAIPVSSTPSQPGEAATLWLGLTADPDSANTVWLESPGNAEGYRLIVGDNNIIVVGDDEAGLFYGLITLRQMIGADGRLPQLAISDWPLLPFRGVHLSLEDQPEPNVRPLSLLKYNTIVVESTDFYDLHDTSKQQRWLGVKALCEGNKIELVPQLQSLGWGIAILQREPRCAEGITVKNALFKVTNGVLVFRDGGTGYLPMKNLIITSAAPLLVRSKDGAVTYVEGVDYEVDPGSALTFPYSPASSSAYTIRTLPGGALWEGQEVYIEYTVLPADTMSCCPSEPVYHEFMRRVITQAIEVLHPRYLHIGHDEPRVMSRDDRCTSRGMTNAQLFAEDVMRMRSYVVEADPSVRMMMWNDAINPLQNANTLSLQDVRFNIATDIVMCGWYYNYPSDNNRIANSVPLFTDLGFDITGSPWFSSENATYWADFMIEHRKTTSHALGVLATTWHDYPASDPWAGVESTAVAAWAGDRTVVALDPPLDSDQDSIPNHLESADDLDGDSIPNYLDEDSDGDGVGDGLEVFFGTNPYESMSAPAHLPAAPGIALLLLWLLLGLRGAVTLRRTVRYTR